jgi:hypothetical protein
MLCNFCCCERADARTSNAIGISIPHLYQQHILNKKGAKVFTTHAPFLIY